MWRRERAQSVTRRVSIHKNTPTAVRIRSLRTLGLDSTHGPGTGRMERRRVDHERAMVAATGQEILARLTPGQRKLAMRIAEVWRAAGEELFLVGGVVRDAAQQTTTRDDLDFATSATPEAARALLEGMSPPPDSIYGVGERFGTMGAVFQVDEHPISVEITTYRQEIYPDGTRFPEVTFGTTLLEDLSRRDFTVNAIAIDPLTAEIIDPAGGIGDLAMSVLRAVGDADERFKEDPLRLLRAARFVSEHGYSVAIGTTEAMSRQAESLGRISIERIASELNRLMMGPYPAAGLTVLRETGLLHAALPELDPMANDPGPRFGREKALWDHTLQVIERTPPRLVVRWSALLHDAAKPMVRRLDERGEVHFHGHEIRGAELAAAVLRRLKLDKATQQGVAVVVENHGRPAAYERDWTDSAVRRLALDLGPWWEDLLALAAADVTSARAQKQEAAAQRIVDLQAHHARLIAEAELDALQSPLDGDDLMRIFQRPPGIWIKRVKDYLRNLVIDGELAVGDMARAEELARDYLKVNP